MCLTILLSTLSIFGTAFLAYLFGSKLYFKQREYENVRKRYLEESVDKISANLDYALGIYRGNWQRCLGNLKLLRDLAEKCTMDSFSFDIQYLDQSLLDIVSYIRLKSLIKNDIFWKIGQLAFAFVGNYNMFIESEIYPIIKLYVENPSQINGSAEDLYNIAFNEIIKKKGEDTQYYKLLTYLQTLCRILEREKLTFKKIDNFPERDDIKELIELAEKDFKNLKDEKLEPIENKIKKDT